MIKIGGDIVNIRLNRDLSNIDKCIKFINENGITRIWLLADFTYDSFDIGFLEGIRKSSQVKGLFVAENSTGAEVLYKFSELEDLFFTPRIDEIIDLSRFPKLKKLSTGNFNSFMNADKVSLKELYIGVKTANFDAVSEISSLKELKMEGIKDFSFNKIRALENLNRVDVDQMNLKNLTGIEKLKNLKKLHIQYARSLERLDGILQLKKLSFVRLISCPKITDISELAESPAITRLDLENIKNCDLTKLCKLKTLESLYLDNCGSVPSLKFIEGLSNLKYFSFIDTNILDGDLRPCLKLKLAATLDKRHYNLKDSELPNEPDPELANLPSYPKAEEILLYKI